MAEKRVVSLDMDDLTFGELEDFEDATGMVMSDAMKTEVVKDPKTGRPVPDPNDPKGRPLKEMKMSARAMMGMVWLALRKDDPELPFSAMRSMKLSEIDFQIEEESAEDESTVDPTQPLADESVSEKSDSAE